MYIRSFDSNLRFAYCVVDYLFRSSLDRQAQRTSSFYDLFAIIGY